MELNYSEVTRLAIYNSEVSKGIVHTPEYEGEMGKLQRRFYEDGYTPPTRSWWDKLIGNYPIR